CTRRSRSCTTERADTLRPCARRVREIVGGTADFRLAARRIRRCRRRGKRGADRAPSHRPDARARVCSPPGAHAMPKMKAYATFDLYLKDQRPKNQAVIRALRKFVKA